MLTVFFGEKLFVLYPEEECLENEGHNDGHHYHCEHVERHEENSEI